MDWSEFGRAPARQLMMATAGVLASTLLACSTAPTSAGADQTPLQQSYAKFQTYLNDCAKNIGVDPRTAKGVGERELLPKEREWRACAYEGIRALLVPTARHPGLYGQLIAEDQSMTDRIAKGTMTRSERAARLDQLREAIAQKEQQSTAEISQAKAERNAELVRQVRGLP